MIGQVYPEAAEHLRAAQEARARLAVRWQESLDDGLTEVTVTTDRDGTGRITVHACWPIGAQEALTEEFRGCLRALWACLDGLITETVSMLGILRQPSAPERPRFFPVAGSQEGFDALLEESCLDGVLITQHQMVRDCQPFRTAPDGPVATMLRTGLRQLLDWTNRLEDGALVGAWVTPVEPQLHVAAPGELLEVVVAEPGRVDDERIVASYRVVNHVEGGVSGQAGSYVDLAFPDGFTPVDTEDTFDSRVRFTIEVVARFAASFAWLSTSVGGARRVADGASGRSGTEWTPAHRSPRRWSDSELTGLRSSDFGVGVVRDGEQLTLLVTTDDGVYERVIPSATPLNRHIERGTAAEAATHNAAATWGLPDFVILPRVEHDGSRNREISDGLIVTGDRGAVLQVKSRNTDSGRPEKESSWVNKKITEAARQVNGTVRRLRSEAAEMINGRGRPVTIDGGTVSWIGVVIIDHPTPPPDHRLLAPAGAVPTVTLLRRDWEFLFDQLRSTRAVIDYLHRVEGPCPFLGGEPERYFELAAADAAAEPAPLDPAIRGERRSVPLLPMAPAGRDDDQAHGLVRVICEDIANTPTAHDEDERIRILATIDKLPVGYRTELGRLLLDSLRTAYQTDAQTVYWNFRTFRSSLDVPQLGFGVCSRFDETIHNAFRSWVLLRHHERGDAEQLTQALSIGVLLTPRSDGIRKWDTTVLAVTGDPALTDEELTQSRHLWNSGELSLPGGAMGPRAFQDR